jgi:hypothetical protein
MDDSIFLGSHRHDGQDSLEEPCCPPLRGLPNWKFSGDEYFLVDASFVF